MEDFLLKHLSILTHLIHQRGAMRKEGHWQNTFSLKNLPKTKQL